MIMINILQRASILTFSKKASSLSEIINAKKNKKKHIKSIMELHEKYVQFENQILLTELTSQEQGIELCDMIAEQLYIEEDSKELMERLYHLYEISNIRSNDKLNSHVFLLTVVTVVLAVLQIAISLFY